MSVKRRGQKRATFTQIKATMVKKYITKSGKVLNIGDIVLVQEVYAKHCIAVDKANNSYDIPRHMLAHVK